MSPTHTSDDGSPVALTATQEGMWFAERLDPGLSGYHDAVTLHFEGPLDIDALRLALNDCRRRHDALRLRVRATGSTLTQSFDAPPPAWHDDDLSGLTRREQEADHRRRFALDCTEPFDLAEGPLWRVRLLRLGREEHQVLMVLHHLMTDGWSHGVFLRSLLSCYGARLSGPPPRVPPAPSFRDWAVRRVAAEGTPLTADRARAAAEELRAAPRRVELPGLTQGRGTRGGVLELPLEADDMARFNTACATARMSRYMTLTGLFAHMIREVAGAPEIVLAAPVADRLTRDGSRTLGCMINTVPIRVVPGDPGLRAAAAGGRSGVVSALQLLAVPYRDVIRAVQTPFGTSLADPLTNLACEEYNSPRGTWQVGDLTVTARPRGEFQARHDLTLSVPLDPAGVPELIYPALRWDAGAVRELAAHLAGLIRSFGWDAAKTTP
ncbi:MULTISPECIES: condensation domain-containing protein [unclassified Streptomyces]|uniref:condensation domain-containing protein n=1 Tax=unclassified Streptomyces TaxID=2593676 RepID=UPI0036E54596